MTRVIRLEPAGLAESILLPLPAKKRLVPRFYSKWTAV